MPAVSHKSFFRYSLESRLLRHNKGRPLTHDLKLTRAFSLELSGRTPVAREVFGGSAKKFLFSHSLNLVY